MTSEAPPGWGADDSPPVDPFEDAESPWARPAGNSRERLRNAGRLILGVLLVLTLGALLLSLSFTQVTAEGPAKRALGQSIAIVSEIDASLDARYEALRQDASDADGSETLSLPDFPIPLSFTPEEISTTAESLEEDRASFRAVLLARAADRIYRDGTDAFREGEGADIGFFSSEGALHNGMNMLRERPHEVFATLTIVLAALAGALGLALGLVCRGYGRMVALGLSVLLAGAPFLALALAARFSFRLAADDADGYLVREFLALGQGLSWAPVRNGIVFTAGGLAILALGAGLALWNDRRRRQESLP